MFDASERPRMDSGLAPDRVGLNDRYLGQIERAEASMGVTVLGDRI